ncbi:MAG: adenylyl-sulfate kinase [Bacteroidia bacterium]|nr:adenylyl-sulfate kinase [Bacteroidia bacterium]
MDAIKKNSYPVFYGMLKRKDKERLSKQHAKAIWMTGLSGSGKTTLAIRLECKLYKMGFFTQILDGDMIRTGISNDLGFSENDRKENIRRVAEAAKLFLDCGIIAICCFISPTREMRNTAGKIIGKKDFIEVYVNAPLDVCEKRDAKGLYKKARKGNLKNFTGIGAPYEIPVKPDIELRTDILSVKKSVEYILEKILPKIKSQR